MPLSDSQRAALEKAAVENGVAAADLIAAAEEEMSAVEREEPSAVKSSASSSSTDPPKLFQYHLAFVRVREVRRVWLGLDEPFPGDNEIAAEWAAKFSGPTSGSAATDEAPIE